MQSILTASFFLISSLVYQFTGFALVDTLGAAGLVYFSVNEGMEAFEKARDLSIDCCCRED
jgi:hypothetical protein